MPIDFICLFGEKKKKRTNEPTYTEFNFFLLSTRWSMLRRPCCFKYSVKVYETTFALCVRDYYTIHGGFRFKTNHRRMKETKQSISYKMFSIPNAKNTDKNLHILIN